MSTNDRSNLTVDGDLKVPPVEPTCPDCGHFALLHTSPSCCTTTPADGIQRLPCGCPRTEAWVLRWALAESQEECGRLRRDNTHLRAEKAIIWAGQA